MTGCYFEEQSMSHTLLHFAENWLFFWLDLWAFNLVIGQTEHTEMLILNSPHRTKSGYCPEQIDQNACIDQTEETKFSIGLPKGAVEIFPNHWYGSHSLSATHVSLANTCPESRTSSWVSTTLWKSPRRSYKTLQSYNQLQQFEQLKNDY